MRGLHKAAGVALAMAAIAGGYLGTPNNFAAHAAIRPAEPRVVERRAPGKKRESVKTLDARRRARREDRFFGIKSKGRNGAVTRQAEMSSAFAKTPIGRRQERGMSNPFTHQARRDAFDAAVLSLSEISGNPAWVIKQAAKAARRVAV